MVVWDGISEFAPFEGHPMKISLKFNNFLQMTILFCGLGCLCHTEKLRPPLGEGEEFVIMVLGICLCGTNQAPRILAETYRGGFFQQHLWRPTSSEGGDDETGEKRW